MFCSTTSPSDTKLLKTGCGQILWQIMQTGSDITALCARSEIWSVCACAPFHFVFSSTMVTNRSLTPSNNLPPTNWWMESAALTPRNNSTSWTESIGWVWKEIQSILSLQHSPKSHYKIERGYHVDPKRPIMYSNHLENAPDPSAIFSRSLSIDSDRTCNFNWSGSMGFCQLIRIHALSIRIG